MVAILAGILNILSAMSGRIPESALTLIRWVGDISASIALVGIYLHQRKSTHAFGLLAFVVAIGGVFRLIFSFNYEQAIMVYALGVILIAISLLRTGSIPRVAAGYHLLAIRSV